MDTIAAIATPPGEGGVGIIRISGPEAPAIAQRVWQGKRAVAKCESHKLYYGEIIDPGRGGSRTALTLDQALLVWMKAPHSYTGEEVIELQTHGGPVLLQEILKVVIAAGACLARPGEFTERAFMNGRMDLSQAEGVADLIHGQSELALTLAHDQLSGRLTDEIGRIRRELVVMRAQLEAMIDYPDDEDVNLLRHEEVAKRVQTVASRLGAWLQTYDEGRLRRDGVRGAIVGQPNVGKSSLLNCLLSDDRAIVHTDAGTTRDVVTETVNLGGILVKLSDTAGLREGDGELEAEGIRRSWQEVERADLVLFVIDRSQAPSDEDRRLFEEIQGKPHLFVCNKSDLPCSPPFEKGGIGGIFSTENPLAVSAKSAEGIPALKQAIIDFALPNGRASDQLFISNLRHKTCLEACIQALKEVQKSAEANAGLELLAADLLIAANHLGEITGEITNDEVLSEIFSRFCLGK